MARCFRGAACPYMLRGRCWFLHGRDDAATAVDGEVTQRALERMHARVVEQIVDLAVPLILEKILEIIPLVPLERIKDQIVEHIGGVPVPQIKEDIVQNLVGEQIVDVPVPQIQDDGLQIVQERVLNRTPEQIVGVSVPQTMEAPVDVMLTTPQERVLNRTQELIVGVPVCLRSRRLPWKLCVRNLWSACRIVRSSRSWILLCLSSWRQLWRIASYAGADCGFTCASVQAPVEVREKPLERVQNRFAAADRGIPLCLSSWRQPWRIVSRSQL